MINIDKVFIDAARKTILKEYSICLNEVSLTFFRAVKKIASDLNVTFISTLDSPLSYESKLTYNEKDVLKQYLRKNKWIETPSNIGTLYWTKRKLISPGFEIPLLAIMCYPYFNKKENVEIAVAEKPVSYYEFEFQSFYTEFCNACGWKVDDVKTWTGSGVLASSDSLGSMNFEDDDYPFVLKGEILNTIYESVIKLLLDHSETMLISKSVVNILKSDAKRLYTQITSRYPRIS